MAGIEGIERHGAWQCIGCGRIDAPRPCVGVCQDRKVELVDARDFDALQARVVALESLLRLVTKTTPRVGGGDACWRIFQERARRLLDEHTRYSGPGLTQVNAGKPGSAQSDQRR